MRGFGMHSVENLGWIEKEAPKAGPNDAMLEPVAVAICSSDTHMGHGFAGDLKERILGHESVGRVVEVGSNVKRFKPGDVCVVNCCTPDWEAPMLQDRNINNAHDYGMMKSFKFCFEKDGVFAERYHVNNADANLVLKPDDVSLEDALMTTDMMSTGFHGVENAEVEFGDNVVVFGIGPVGLMAIAGSALSGAARVIGIGTRPNCAKLAREFGATDIVSYKDGDLVEQIHDLIGQADKVILAGGNCDSLDQALKMTRPNGIVSNINFVGINDIYKFPAADWGLGMSNITLRCGFCPGGGRRIERLLRLIQAGRIHPGKMLNYKFEGFDKIPDAFDIMDKKPRDLIKSYVVM